MGHPAAGGCEYLSSVLPLEAILMSMATTDISHVTTEGMWLSVACVALEVMLMSVACGPVLHYVVL